MVLVISILTSAPDVMAALADGSHITQNAETLKQWQWAFKPFPGANPTAEYTSFLTNSLSLGVTDNWEVGFIPLAWQTAGNISMFNFNIRHVSYRNEWWTFSYGLQAFHIETQVREPVNSYFSMATTTLAFANTFVLNPDWRMTHNIAIRSTRLSGYYVDTSNGSYATKEIESPLPIPYADNYLDFSYTKSLTNVWAFGFSRATDSIFGMHMPGANAVWGTGVTHTWNLRRSWLSQLSAGMHFLDNGSRRFLFGLAF